MSERRGTSKWVRSWTAALLATGLAASSAFALEAGDIAPSFRAPRLDGGGTVALEDLRGKVVFLDFWASW